MVLYSCVIRAMREERGSREKKVGRRGEIKKTYEEKNQVKMNQNRNGRITKRTN